MTYIHGSPNRMEVGDIILPGDEVGFCSSGGRSDFVYFLDSSDGIYSLSEFTETFGKSSVSEVSMEDARYWAGEDGFIYEVEPLEDVFPDDHFDMNPNSYKTKKAKILKVL